MSHLVGELRHLSLLAIRVAAWTWHLDSMAFQNGSFWFRQDGVAGRKRWKNTGTLNTQVRFPETNVAPPPLYNKPRGCFKSPHRYSPFSSSPSDGWRTSCTPSAPSRAQTRTVCSLKMKKTRLTLKNHILFVIYPP